MGRNWKGCPMLLVIGEESIQIRKEANKLPRVGCWGSKFTCTVSAMERGKLHRSLTNTASDRRRGSFTQAAGCFNSRELNKLTVNKMFPHLASYWLDDLFKYLGWQRKDFDSRELLCTRNAAQGHISLGYSSLNVRREYIIIFFTKIQRCTLQQIF